MGVNLTEIVETAIAFGIIVTSIAASVSIVTVALSYAFSSKKRNESKKTDSDDGASEAARIAKTLNDDMINLRSRRFSRQINKVK